MSRYLRNQIGILVGVIAVVVATIAMGRVAAPAEAAPTTTPAAFHITRASLAKSASFVVTQTTSPKGSAPLTRTFTIQIDGNFARADYEDPALGSVRYLANAQGVFLFIPGNKTATKYNFKGGVEAALRQAFQFITAQGADLKKVGAATVSGQPTIVYKNVKNGALVYVGQRPGFRLPVKATLTNEGGTQSFVVSNIKLDKPVPGAQFALPPGTQIISGESGSGVAGLPGAGGGKGE